MPVRDAPSLPSPMLPKVALNPSGSASNQLDTDEMASYCHLGVLQRGDGRRRLAMYGNLPR